MWVTDKHSHTTRNKYLKSDNFCKVGTNRKSMCPNTVNIEVIQQQSETSELLLLNCLHWRRLIVSCKQNSSSEHWLVRKNRRWVERAPSSPSQKHEDTTLTLACWDVLLQKANTWAAHIVVEQSLRMAIVSLSISKYPLIKMWCFTCLWFAKLFFLKMNRSIKHHRGQSSMFSFQAQSFTIAHFKANRSRWFNF